MHQQHFSTALPVLLWEYLSQMPLYGFKISLQVKIFCAICIYIGVLIQYGPLNCCCIIGQMLIVLWIYFCFFINIFYNVEFRSSLISPEFETPINAFEDVNIEKAAMFYATSGDQDRQYVQAVPMEIYHNVLFAGPTNLYSDCETKEHYGKNIDWTDFNLKVRIKNYLINCGGSVVMHLEEYNNFAVEWMSRKETHNQNFLLRHSTHDPVNISMKHLTIIMNEKHFKQPESVLKSSLRIMETGIVAFFSHTPIYYDVTQNPNMPEFSGELSKVKLEYLYMSFNVFFVFLLVSISIFSAELCYKTGQRIKNHYGPKWKEQKARMAKQWQKIVSHLAKFNQAVVTYSLGSLAIILLFLLVGYLIIEILWSIDFTVETKPQFGSSLCYLMQMKNMFVIVSFLAFLVLLKTKAQVLEVVKSRGRAGNLSR